MNQLNIEYLQIDKLKAYEKNSRVHTATQLKQIEASIKEFGFTNPVLIDGDFGIIAGHCRVMAARNIGVETVPCLRLGHLNEDQKRAYIIADNKLAENSGWDDELLRLELRDLAINGFDVGLIGFSQDELEALLNGIELLPAGGGQMKTTLPKNRKSPYRNPAIFGCWVLTGLFVGAVRTLRRFPCAWGAEALT